MVKLLRLQSNIGTLNFDSILQDSLIIDSNSKIALMSVTWEKSANEITIDNSNDLIKYSLEVGDERSFRLTHNTYSVTNQKEFLKDFQIQWNDNLVKSTPKAIGTQIHIYVENQNIIIRSTQSPLISFPSLGTTTDYEFDKIDEDTITIGTLKTEQYSKETGTVDGTYDAGTYGISSNSQGIIPQQGCGVHRLQISDLDIINKGLYIGYSSLSGDKMAGNFTFSNMEYGILAESDEFYTWRKNGIQYQSDSLIPVVSPQDLNNDIIEISSSFGYIRGVVYRWNITNQATDEYILFNSLGDEDPLQLIKYYPMIAISGLTSKFIKPRYTPRLNSPEINKLLLSNELFDPLTNKADQQDLQDEIIELEFPTLEMASFLGFNNVDMTINSRVINFISDFIPIVYDASEAYIVELTQGLNLLSYDMSEGKQKRRNILAVIQNTRNKSEPDVLYENNRPMMIDINNQFKLLLKNLNMRIITTDEKRPIKINGYAEAVILIE